MRALSAILMIAGLCLSGIAAYQEWSGHTTRPYLGRTSAVLEPLHIYKASDPKLFRHAMAVHWIYAGAAIFLGVSLMLIIKGQDRLDPLAPDADSEDDEDEPKQ